MVGFLKIFKNFFSFFFSSVFGLGLLVSSGCKEDSKTPAHTYPYFAALKASKINARCGPGMTYPIEWVFIKSDIPVEVLEEHEHWRKIRDFQGDEAWINKTMLKKKRMGIVQAKTLPLYSDCDKKSPPLAYLARGVLLEIKNCNGTWCQVKVQDFKGFVEQKGLFGVFKEELF